MTTNGNTACFVTPLNHSEADPKTVKANMKMSNVDGSDSDIFRITESAIKKPAFLGKTINSMCSGVSIYWLSPTCGDRDLAEEPGSEDDSSTRHKRAVLACVDCGCIRLCAPWVRCTRKVNMKEKKIYFTAFYKGGPAYYSRLAPPCKRFKLLGRYNFPDATTSAVTP
ncbi:hypothetical protein LSAT2_013995 [Lamellibrachia satsuma]|nr:hypothetical protein LSAT2_013995 [Lamellibrachia satsuma]